MGNYSSKSRQRQPTEAKSVQGLLPVGNLTPINYDIENLVFAGGVMEAFSYSGAVRVLEKLCLLQGVKRFSGVSTGAMIATFLALDFNSKETQTAFNDYLDNVLLDGHAGYDSVENLSKNYGCNSGAEFTDWFGRLLESRSFDSETSFLQLYKKTGKELCVVVTNVDKLRIEYCHPKITPDMPIKLALFMSLSIPGVFAPARYGPGVKGCYYVSGGLLCNYPIHSFDGWLLSMDPKDLILNRLESLDHYLLPDKVFDSRNERTLGFFRICKHQETVYKEFVDRLIDSGADLKSPNTALGEKYKSSTQKRLSSAEKFIRLRKACSTLFLLADSLKIDETVSLDTFASKIFMFDSLSRNDCVSCFPEFGTNRADLKNFLSSLVDKDHELQMASLSDFLQSKLLSLLDDHSDHYKSRAKNLHTYFSMAFNALPHSAMRLAKSDYDRSVGILCGHVGNCNTELQDADQMFLYRQGWNATVSYFRQIDKQIAEGQTI